MITVNLSYSDFKNQIAIRQTSVQYITLDYGYDLYLIDGSFSISCVVKEAADKLHFEENYKASGNKKTLSRTEPFASKLLKDGKSVFARTHGEEYPVVVGDNTLLYTIPYPQVKINEIEVIDSESGDSLDFLVLDSTTGSYTTVPNKELNQFGFDVKMSNGYYRRKSNYDADLYQGMQIKVVYNSKSIKTVYINYVLHEVK